MTSIDLPLSLSLVSRLSSRWGADFLHAEAASLFRTPEVTPPADLHLEWRDPDDAGIIQFLVTEKGFSLDRVESALKRLKGARQKASQQRIEGFFKLAPSSAAGEKFEKPNAKRKEAPTTAAGKKAAAAAAKKAKTTSKKK